MLWDSGAFSEFRTSLSKVLTLWHYVKVKQCYQFQNWGWNWTNLLYGGTPWKCLASQEMAITAIRAERKRSKVLWLKTFISRSAGFPSFSPYIPFVLSYVISNLSHLLIELTGCCSNKTTFARVSNFVKKCVSSTKTDGSTFLAYFVLKLDAKI